MASVSQLRVRRASDPTPDRAEFRERPRPFRRIRNVGSELGVVATGNQPPAPLQREASVVFSLSGIFPSSHFRVKRRKRRRFARRAVVIKRCVHATLRSGARNGTEANGSVQRALLQYKKKQKKNRKETKKNSVVLDGSKRAGLSTLSPCPFLGVLR